MNNGFIKIIRLSIVSLENLTKANPSKKNIFTASKKNGEEEWSVQGCKHESEIWKSWRFKRTNDGNKVEVWGYVKMDDENRTKVFEFDVY